MKNALGYWAIPSTIPDLQIDWMPKIKVISLLSIFAGIALGAQTLWELCKNQYRKYNNNQFLKKRMARLNPEERSIISQMLFKKNQSSLVTKKICYFGKEISGRFYDFHITDEAWEILERSKHLRSLIQNNIE